MFFCHLHKSSSYHKNKILKILHCFLTIPPLQQPTKKSKEPRNCVYADKLGIILCPYIYKWACVAAVDEGILHLPDQTVVISHHLSLSAMQICWAVLQLVWTKGSSGPDSKHDVGSKRGKDGNFTLWLWLSSALCNYMLMNPTLLDSFFFNLFLHHPRASAHGFSAKLSRVLACELDLLWAVLLHSTALWYCPEVSVPPGRWRMVLNWVFFVRAELLMSHLMLRTSILGNFFFILQSPWNAFFMIHHLLKSSLSWMLHFLFFLFLPFNFVFLTQPRSSPTGLITLF